MSSEESQIRKFRKKLRQIEHLKSLRRELTPDEIRKVATKDSIRSQLQILLTQIIEESEPAGTPHRSRSRFKLPETPREQSLDESAYFLEPRDAILEEHEKNQQPDLHDNSPESDMRKRKRAESCSDLEKLQNENNENRINGKQLKEDVTDELQNLSEDVRSAVPTASTSTSQPNEDLRKKYRELEHAKVAVTELKGHSDIVWALSSDDNFIVSGSRDTTARVWDPQTGEELCSLRGHTGSVNGVAVLNRELSHELARKLDSKEVNQIVVTAASDCSIRLWTVPSGKQLKFIYTFNSITCFGIIEHLFFSVTGTDAGKVEVWDVAANSAVYSNNAHAQSVSCLEVKGSQFCSGSLDGMVIIWTLVNKKVQILYQLDPEAIAEIPRPKSLLSVASHYGRLFLGDSEANIKVLSWRRGRMHAVRNHPCNYGCTNALTTFDDLLVSSSFNLDSGLGSINIRLLPEVEYICSIQEQARKILCLSCSWNKDGKLCVISGGEELLIWDFVDSSCTLNGCNAAEIVDVNHIALLDYEPEKIENEELSSDMTDDEQDSCIKTSSSKEEKLASSVQVTKSSWTDWCNLI